MICTYSDATVVKGRTIFDQYKEMWAVFGELYFAVKHAGHQTPERIADVVEKIQQFCPLFQKLCVAGEKEPTPKFHVLKEHMLCFIRIFRMSWRTSEEAGEAIHHQLNAHIDRNANQHGDERKLLGTLQTFQHACSFTFQKNTDQLIEAGTRRKRKPKVQFQN